MCGIAGYVGVDKPSLAMKMAFFIMATEMDDRGGHSWGWTNWDKIDKGLALVRDGLTTENFDSPSAAVHTRFGTTGEKIAENSHPFLIHGATEYEYRMQGDVEVQIPMESGKQIIGMHNGIVYNHTELNRDYGRKCEVDSMHIFHHIVNEVPLDTIEAYGAIVYQQDGVIYGGRFNGGELSIALTKEGLVYASTKYAIERALELSGVELVHFFQVVEGELYRFAADNLYVHGKIDITESLYSYKWSDSKYAQSEWWKKEPEESQGSPYTSWEKDIERLDRQTEDDGPDGEDIAYMGHYDECEFCQAKGGTLYYHKDDDVIICAECAWEEYGHAAPHTYEVTQNARFRCEECDKEYGGEKKHGFSKYRMDRTGLVICAKCFWSNHNDTNLKLIQQGSVILAPTTKSLVTTPGLVKV